MELLEAEPFGLWSRNDRGGRSRLSGASQALFEVEEVAVELVRVQDAEVVLVVGLVLLEGLDEVLVGQTQAQGGLLGDEKVVELLVQVEHVGSYQHQRLVRTRLVGLEYLGIQTGPLLLEPQSYFPFFEQQYLLGYVIQQKLLRTIRLPHKFFGKDSQSSVANLVEEGHSGKYLWAKLLIILFSQILWKRSNNLVPLKILQVLCPLVGHANVIQYLDLQFFRDMQLSSL